MVALDPSYSMKTMWGVKSYAMVEESAFVEQSPPVPSMDQYSLMAGGSQSLTTFAAGGDAWKGNNLNIMFRAKYFVSSPGGNIHSATNNRGFGDNGLWK